MRHPNYAAASSSKAGGGGGRSNTTPTPCCSKVGMKRGPWTPEEDEMLSKYIIKEGEGKWRTLPKRAGLQRCGKSCRLRWMNYLRPDVKRGHIAPDEEDLILRLHRLLGNRWSLIAGRIPGRTDNEIKNYWNTHLSKKLVSQGIDPRTHKPLSPDSPSNDKPSSSKPNRPQKPKFVAPPTNDPIVPNEETHAYLCDEANMISNHFPYVNLQSSEGIRAEANDNEEDDDVNYCTDDVFSSFLNSLINEDVFNNNHNQMNQQELSNWVHIVPHDDVGGSNALIFPPETGFAFGSGWDAPIMSSSNQNHDAQKFINDQVGKQL